jgi:hypothetical protein
VTAAPSDSNQLQLLGQQLAAALIDTYGISGSSANLAFLPGGIAVPDDLVQSGVVNPAQVQTWLSVNFDYPFAISSDTAAAWTREDSYGTATQIYTEAVSLAQPAGDPASAACQRVAAEITEATTSLGPPDTQTLTCTPDDWAVPSESGYWTAFDSTQASQMTSSSSSATSSSSSPSAPSVASLPIVDARFWTVRSLAAPATIAAASSSSQSSSSSSQATATVAPPILVRPEIMMERPMAPEMVREPAPSAAPASAPKTMPIARPIALNAALLSSLDARAIFAGATSVEQATTSSSATVTIQLEHQLVTIGRLTSGQPWWDGVFLADPGWYIPGMPQGGLLPPPADAAIGATNALPIAMIIVRNLSVSGQWTQAAAAALTSEGAALGPLSLSGATATTASDGVTITFEQDGMQVVALLCATLPVLPPTDSAGATAPSSASSSTSSSSVSSIVSSSSSSASSSSALSSSALSSSSSNSS